MRKENRKLIVNLIDLDHILDFEEIDKTRPPSEMFILGLKNELDLNGLDYLEIDSIEIQL